MGQLLRYCFSDRAYRFVIIQEMFQIIQRIMRIYGAHARDIWRVGHEAGALLGGHVAGYTKAAFSNEKRGYSPCRPADYAGAIAPRIIKPMIPKTIATLNARPRTEKTFLRSL